MSQPLQQQIWLTPWNTDQVSQNATRYQSISAFWLTVQPDGVTFQPKADWSIWKSYIAANKKPGQTYVLTVSGDPDAVFLALSDPQKRTTHINNLLQTVKDQGFDGIDIDYEGLGSENSDLFTQFITQLSAAFKASNKTVDVTVEARIGSDPPMDWAALAKVADQVRVMVYDYHGINTGQPGPIAPIGWLQEVLDYAKKTVPQQKLAIGIGDYGYDWAQPTDPSVSWSGTGIGYDQAMALAKQYNQKVTRATGIDVRGYDIGSIPTFSYTDSNNQQHQVWFEDQSSLQAKLDLISQYSTAGVIFWSVGVGDTNF